MKWKIKKAYSSQHNMHQDAPMSNCQKPFIIHAKNFNEVKRACMDRALVFNGASKETRERYKKTHAKDVIVVLED